MSELIYHLQKASIFKIILLVLQKTVPGQFWDNQASGNTPVTLALHRASRLGWSLSKMVDEQHTLQKQNPLLQFNHNSN